jgi:hypothetical protein
MQQNPIQKRKKLKNPMLAETIQDEMEASFAAFVPESLLAPLRMVAGDPKGSKMV